MSEEKTLDEKTLEGVAGGDLIDGVDLQQGGRCRSCALEGAVCPFFHDFDAYLIRSAGEQICEKYVPKT